MAGNFNIHIQVRDDYLFWSTSFENGSQLEEANVDYINNITIELAKALEKLQKLTPQKTADKV